MARLVFNAGQTASGRVHGVVHATYPGIAPDLGRDATSNPVLRAGSVPVQPATSPQVLAQVALSQCAYGWSLLSPAEQAAWATFGPQYSPAYNNFCAWNTRKLTWGSSIDFVAPSAGIEPDTILSWAQAQSDGGYYNLWLYNLSTANPPFNYNLHCYVQASSMIPSEASGYSGNTPGLPGPFPYVKPSGYVYWRTLEGLTSGAVNIITMPDQWLGIAGLAPIIAPVPTSYVPGTYNGFDCIAYQTGPANIPPFRIVVPGVGEGPAYMDVLSTNIGSLFYDASPPWA